MNIITKTDVFSKENQEKIPRSKKEVAKRKNENQKPSSPAESQDRPNDQPAASNGSSNGYLTAYHTGRPSNNRFQSTQNRNFRSNPRQPRRDAPLPVIRSKPLTIGEKKLRIIPIGGLEEIGKNMTIFEYGKDIVIIDMGL